MTDESTLRTLLGAVLVLSFLVAMVGMFPALRTAGRLRAANLTIGCGLFGTASGITAIALFVPPAQPVVAIVHPAEFRPVSVIILSLVVLSLTGSSVALWNTIRNADKR